MATSTQAEKYEVLEIIGRGSFGIIRKVRRISDGHILCRKEISYIKMSQKEREQLHAEFSILNSLKHPNIVGYYHREHLKPTQELYLYMEYCGGGDLSKEIEKLRRNNQYADEEYVWSIFSQLIAALYRCHYGVDAPEVGKDYVGVAPVRQQGLRMKNQVMILHRDLKPENVFLGADNSVKLGDFGLSKLMQSHDFASTYVGTPFYMSPEICAAERYTLHSDIWSLGCIMYELCARTQPFDAKTHFHLIQKIKEGRLEPLPSVYSQELQSVIKSCLNVNPLKRPDTTTLLNHSVVRLMRKQREVEELGRVLREKGEQMRLKTEEVEAQLLQLHNERGKLRAEIRAELDSILRREWEVKAGLEISRQVQMEKERLNKIFETEIELRVKTEVERHVRAEAAKAASEPSPTKEHMSSVSTSSETDFPSTTDLSSLSLDTPPIIKSQTPPRRSSRGPLQRAQTQFDSPRDIQMSDPSPMSIASLSLSPRRTEAAKSSNLFVSKNIFAAATHKTRLPPPTRSPRTSMLLEEDEDSLPDLPSPTRSSQGLPDPFKTARPGMLRQKTAPLNRLGGHPQPALFAHTAAERPKIRSPPSPKHSGFSPVRKAPTKTMTAGGNENEMFKAVVQRNLLGANAGGRTLVELAQARAGGVSLASRTEKEAEMIEARKEKENVRGDVPLWDPEKDEMPSPFLVRGVKGLRRS